MAKHLSPERDPNRCALLEDHLELTRRYFLGLSAAGLAGVALPSSATAAGKDDAALVKAIGALQYFTPQPKFISVERGNPLPYKLPPEKLKAAGLTRESWQLEIVPDMEMKGPKPALGKPLSKKDGTAFTFKALMKLAETAAVRFPKIMTCNNMASPLGMGLWEGVPLRDVLWLAEPKENVRRVQYHGYHNEDPKQLFQSTLPVGRVLEDPPGMPPVILCYKLNGDWITGQRGGPVRMVVPEAYGFKSVKWITRVTLSNLHHANDTYAGGNNDVDSWMKTFARFVNKPGRAKPGAAIPITGLCQVGISGLKKVQVWATPKDAKRPAGDPYFTKAPWTDAKLLPAPTNWGGGLPGGKLTLPVRGFDDKTGRPKRWPMPFTLAHWAILLPGLPAGRYDVRCRTIDDAGHTQPLPRPFPKSGRNAIERQTLIVEG
jgi:DMSO/TMAO reductase YedYZ molybdopterin-dependent catalytic subunit